MNIELLISLVKKHDEIYNKQNSKFSSFKHKARVWQKIAKEMHVEGGNHFSNYNHFAYMSNFFLIFLLYLCKIKFCKIY